MTVFELRKRLENIPNQASEIYISQCKTFGQQPANITNVVNDKNKTLIVFDEHLSR